MTLRLLAIGVAAIAMPPAGAACAQERPSAAAPHVGANGSAMMTIATAIRNQVQPCANRQVIPAPEASQIIAVVQLHLNPDGSLAKLEILNHQGVTEANQRYVVDVDKAVQAIFAGCTPFHGLPAELYDVPRVWREIKFRYRLSN